VCENMGLTANCILCACELGTVGLRESGNCDKQGNCFDHSKGMYTNCVPNCNMWSGEDQIGSVGVNVCGNGHCMS